ncbi:SHOCT domain-containing protein [Streptomyces sp. NPDC014734]|uniref:SHOCT domain-containing protein n=1 Tax=Streptomyces sp. NPDC014734 TaxID=3364886 RepID=UPI0036FC90F0
MDNYPLLNLFWTMLWFFLWIMWLFLLFKVIADIFRSDDLGGWAKAGWLIVALLLPYLGVLLYVIVRGRSMGGRDAKQAQEREAAFRTYLRDAVGTPGPHAADASSGPKRDSHVDDLTKLAELRDRGALTEEEYQRAKAKLLV